MKTYINQDAINTLKAERKSVIRKLTDIKTKISKLNNPTSDMFNLKNELLTKRDKLTDMENELKNLN